MGDLDGDGDLDAFIGNTAANIVWLNRDQPVTGDSNGDFRFDQADIVLVLQAARFRTGQHATFEEGDWNNDGLFDQLDIVSALQAGHYLNGLNTAQIVDELFAQN